MVPINSEIPGACDNKTHADPHHLPIERIPLVRNCYLLSITTLYLI